MIRLVPLIFVTVLPACADGVDRRPAPDVVRVAAASDLKFAFDEIGAAFMAVNPSLRVEPTYGSSGSFHAQLRQRAPFDLFLSADLEYPRDLVARGIGTETDLFTYAIGRLVVWVPDRSPLTPDRDGLTVLDGARRIAIANPRHAPYGRAAEAAVRSAGLWDRLEHRIVLGENVAQAAQFVQSGAADAALIGRSLAAAPPLREAGRFWEVPQDAYPILLQGGLLLRSASGREPALKLRDFLLGPEGQAILTAHGFALPD